MAFNPAPSAWITGWSENGTTISIPISSFPETNATECDGTTGDIRKVLYAICHQLYAYWAAQASTDLPTKMTIAYNAYVDSTTNVSTKTYTLQFKTTPTGEEVTSE